MFSKRKRIEELERFDFLNKERISKLSSELTKVKSDRNSLSKLFSSIFHRYTLTDIEKLVVDKPDDFNSTLKLWMKDGRTYEYKISLIKQGYEEEF
jgi:hypothetical protein